MAMNCTGLGVHIKVKNILGSRRFYEETLDLVPVFGYGDGAFRSTLPPEIPSVGNDGLPGAPERYNGVTYEPTPQSTLEIGTGHVAVPDRSVFTTPVSGPKVSAMLQVDSLLPLVGDKGLRPKFPVRHYYWGTLEIALKDPDGFVIVLVAPYSDSEFDALSSLVNVERIGPGGAA